MSRNSSTVSNKNTSGFENTQRLNKTTMGFREPQALIDIIPTTVRIKSQRIDKNYNRNLLLFWILASLMAALIVYVALIAFNVVPEPKNIL
jgi:hypothetical protein